jgi:hypothetical protein
MAGGNTLLNDKTLEKLVVLRMNRNFMVFIRENYFLENKALQPFNLAAVTGAWTPPVFQKLSSPAGTPTQLSAFENFFRKLSTAGRPWVSRMRKFVIQPPQNTTFVAKADLNAA